MKLLAQQGSMEGRKVVDGLRAGQLDGVILSPRDVAPSDLAGKFAQYRDAKPDVSLLFDPQLYAAMSAPGDGLRLGHLLDEYSAYFQSRRRRQLERESAVTELLSLTLRYQSQFGDLSALIAPGILIPRSFDSVEAVIARNFIRLARSAHSALGEKRRLLATLAVSREALLDKQLLTEFVNEITALEEPPDGFYLLVSVQSTEARTEVYNADVIAAWMYLNYALAVNGYETVNGYADVVGPFLGVAGGAWAATGWWSNLRAFSLDRFGPSPRGGRQPTPRYLSAALLNRLTFSELDQLRRLVPEVLNGLPSDSAYPEENGSEPERAREVLQTWDTIQALNRGLRSPDTATGIGVCREAVERAAGLYDRIEGLGITLDTKSNREHLDALREGLRVFGDLAELGP